MRDREPWKEFAFFELANADRDKEFEDDWEKPGDEEPEDDVFRDEEWDDREDR